VLNPQVKRNDNQHKSSFNSPAFTIVEEKTSKCVTMK